jgi:hypothetical protein
MPGNPLAEEGHRPFGWPALGLIVTPG